MRTERKVKTAKQLERHLKGVANHNRIEILMMVAKENGLSLEDISERLGSNFKTVSEHTRKLVQAGLINKKYQGRKVLHSLSPYGITFFKFLKMFRVY